jgi:hypothetical protein
VLTGEAIYGGVGQRRGMIAVEVEHRPREPAMWTVRSTERLRSSRRRRWAEEWLEWPVYMEAHGS